VSSTDHTPQQDAQRAQADEALRRVQQDPNARPAGQAHAERMLRALLGV
jgi:hypothetical protein